MDRNIEIIEPTVFKDERGVFRKYVFPFKAKEQFYSFNHAGVLRGMHFQKGTAKFVYVSSGTVIDIWLNLKTKQWGQITLVEGGNAVYIPAGFAHGFYSVTDSIIHYLQDQPYSKEYEGGVKWDSFGFKLPGLILSERDKNHPHYENFNSYTLL